MIWTKATLSCTITNVLFPFLTLPGNGLSWSSSRNEEAFVLETSIRSHVWLFFLDVAVDESIKLQVLCYNGTIVCQTCTMECKHTEIWCHSREGTVVVMRMITGPHWLSGRNKSDRAAGNRRLAEEGVVTWSTGSSWGRTWGCTDTEYWSGNRWEEGESGGRTEGAHGFWKMWSLNAFNS